MFISSRAAQVRSLLVASINGSITLIILLIAPLGLAAVIINTLLVTLASYGMSQTVDKVIVWLSLSFNPTTDSHTHNRVASKSKIMKKRL